jgi:hypothetical protein
MKTDSTIEAGSKTQAGNGKTKNINKKKFDWSVPIQLAILCVLLLMASSIFITLMYKNTGALDSPEAVFSIIITSLGFLITGSVLLPKYAIKKEIEDAVEARSAETEKRISSELKMNLTNFEKKNDILYAKKDDLLATDAHLSRMVAYFLEKEIPIWAIGWGLRSLKRYIRLEKQKKANYLDFLHDVYVILVNSKQRIYHTLSEKKDIDEVLESLDSFIRESMSETISEEESYRLVLRCVKDYLDLYYRILDNHGTWIKEGYGDLYGACLEYLHSLGVLVKLFIMTLNKYYAQPPKDLAGKIKRISDYSRVELFVTHVEKCIDRYRLDKNAQPNADIVSLFKEFKVDAKNNTENSYRAETYQVFDEKVVIESLKQSEEKGIR